MRYRKIDPRIWNDERFRALTDDGQLVFLFVLTHPHMTCLGAMRATVEGLAGEKGWSEQRMRDAIGDAIQDGMVVANPDACFLGVPKFLKYNQPEGPNSVTKAWPEALDLIPECPEKVELITRVCAYLDGKSDAFRHAIPDGIIDAMRLAMSHPGAGAGAGAGDSVSFSLSLSGTQGLEGKTKKKRAPVKPARRVVETWLTPFGDLWQDVTQGVFHYAKAAAVLKPLVERHGPDVTLAAFTDYLVATPIDKLSVARFAETIGQYLAGTDGQTPARRAGGLGGPSPEDLAAEEAKKAEWIRQDLADMAAEARGGKP